MTWFVVVLGSGTGDLRGLRGEGGFASGQQIATPLRLTTTSSDDDGPWLSFETYS